MADKNCCPHLAEMQMQSMWCCYIQNKMVTIQDCKSCKYGRAVIVKGVVKGDEM